MNENEVVEKVKRNSPSREEFAVIWNTAESRNDALQRFQNAGFDVKYGGMLARYKNLKSNGVNLKDMPYSPRGRRINAAAINQVLAQLEADKNKNDGTETAEV